MLARVAAASPNAMAMSRISSGVLGDPVTLLGRPLTAAEEDEFDPLELVGLSGITGGGVASAVGPRIDWDPTKRGQAEVNQNLADQTHEFSKNPPRTPSDAGIALRAIPQQNAIDHVGHAEHRAGSAIAGQQRKGPQ